MTDHEAYLKAAKRYGYQSTVLTQLAGWRDLQLQSLGWRVCRFWVYELRENLPRCVERVVQCLA